MTGRKAAPENQTTEKAPSEGWYVLKTILSIGGIVLFVALVNLPRAIAQAIGFCYRRRFDLADGPLMRPPKYSSKPYKIAFQDLGSYVTDALTRDMMYSFQDDSLADKGGLFGRYKISLDVWHEVLAYFAEQGVIEERWTLSIPTIGLRGEVTQHKYVPQWGPKGEKLESAGKDTVLAGFQPEEGGFSPSLLTTAQRDSLIGTEYAMQPSEKVDTGEAMPKHRVGQEDMTRIYYRNRKVLTDASYRDGAIRFRRAVKIAQG